MSIEAYYTKIATLNNKVRKQDNMAGWTETLQPIRRNIACAVQPLSSSEMAYAQSISVVATHKIYCAYIREIEPSRVLTIDGINYDIKGVIDAAGRNHHLEIIVELRK